VKLLEKLRQSSLALAEARQKLREKTGRKDSWGRRSLFRTPGICWLISLRWSNV